MRPAAASTVPDRIWLDSNAFLPGALYPLECSRSSCSVCTPTFAQYPSDLVLASLSTSSMYKRHYPQSKD